MQRKRRTRILIDYGKETALKMSEEIEKHYLVEMISDPKEALTMIKMRETAQNSLFYAGEVLVTETKVRIENQVGIGLVKGNQREFSRALAIIDAAFAAKLPETLNWIPVLDELEHAGEMLWQAKQDRLALTKVNFETMNQ